MISEEELIAEYRATVRPLYAYISKRTGGQRDLAEDVVQETYLRAVSHWRRNGKPRVPLAWLKTVARNTLISHYRRVKPDSLEHLDIDLEGESQSQQETENTAVLFYGLSQLNKGQSSLLEAFHIEGNTVQEMSSELGLSERAVEGRLRRARLKLKKYLRQCSLDGGRKAERKGVK